MRRSIADFRSPAVSSAVRTATACRVFAGAAAADLDRDRGEPRAGDSLRAAPLTILALGPATNVATMLAKHPELASRVTRVIAVAGGAPASALPPARRTPAVIATSTSSSIRGGFQVLLDSKVEVVLAPFEISSKIWLTGSDLDRLARLAVRAARALAAPARAWLALWTRLFGVDGFNPFDTLAVAYAISSKGLAARRLTARIDTLPDDVTEPACRERRSIGNRTCWRPNSLAGAAARVTYCSTAPTASSRTCWPG